MYALMEMGYDSPDLPIGMVTNLHLKRCMYIQNTLFSSHLSNVI
jgi:hypothetical protein